MDKMQIVLKLALDYLGLAVEEKNYRTICSAVYLAEQRGVYLTGCPIYVNSSGVAYSPLSHESSGMPSRNLLIEVREIEEELRRGMDDSKGWKLEEKAKRALDVVKAKLKI